MARGVVRGHKVVQAGIYGARAQTQGHTQCHKPAKRWSNRKPQQRQRRHQAAGCHHCTGAYALGNGAGKEAGRGRADGHGDGDSAHRRQRLAHVGADGGPGHAQNAVRQAQADEGHIHNAQKNEVRHGGFLNAVLMGRAIFMPNMALDPAVFARAATLLIALCLDSSDFSDLARP